MLAGSLEIPSATGLGAVSVTGHSGITIQPVTTSMHWAGWKSLRMLEDACWWLMMDWHSTSLFCPKFEAKKLGTAKIAPLIPLSARNSLWCPRSRQKMAETNGVTAWGPLTIAFDNFDHSLHFPWFVVQDRSGNRVVEWLVCCSLILFVAIPFRMKCSSSAAFLQHGPGGSSAPLEGGRQIGQDTNKGRKPHKIWISSQRNHFSQKLIVDDDRQKAISRTLRTWTRLRIPRQGPWHVHQLCRDKRNLRFE